MIHDAPSRPSRNRQLEAYRSAPFRTPALLDACYPAEPEQLQTLLDSYLASVEEPSDSQFEEEEEEVPNWRGLLSPHIDYARGGPVYAQVWKGAEQAVRNADLVVIFGTDHQSNDPFTLTRQHYATPYGILPTAQSIVNALAEVIGEEQAFGGELRHANEHSLELVFTWLHHMRQGQPVEAVPILCGGFFNFIFDESDPAESQLLLDVLETLKEEIADRNVLVVASGDLAHVGPAFRGHPMTNERRAVLHQHDEELIAQMSAGDAESFFESIRRVRDSNNVCGVSPIYLSMRLMELLASPIEGTLCGYDTCPADRFNTSVVTIGGMLFK